MAVRGGVVRLCAAAFVGMCILGAASERPALRIDEASTHRVATRHRIQLPDGSQIMLRREYRVIFRTPMRWGDGMLLERAYVASRMNDARVSRAA